VTTWERRIIGILTLGGSFLGIVIGLTLLISQNGALAKIVCVPFLLLYAWGMWCGLLLLESQQRALSQSAWFWGIQIPYFTSPVAGYMFASGSFANVTYEPSSSTINFFYLFGSKFEYSLLQADKSLVIGINLFAVAVLALLVYRLVSSPPNNSFKPMPLRGTA